jgi:predicted  nucleic acid-binding Zn-ribbon protein
VLFDFGNQGMETIRETLRQERVLAEPEELSTRIKEAHSEIEFLHRRLDRLAKLQSLLKEKYHSRLDSLSTQLSGIDIQQRELKSLTKQLKRNKERRSIIKEQVASLERRKKTIREVIKQITGYRKSSNAQVEVIEEEQEILFQRIHDLEHTLELVEQAELNKKELEIVSQRIYVTKRLLEEHEIDLSKRTIDLLFEFYIPPKNNKRPHL